MECGSATAVALGACGAGARAGDPDAERKALAALRELDAVAKVDEPTRQLTPLSGFRPLAYVNPAAAT